MPQEPEQYEFNEERTKRRPKRPPGHARRFDEDWQDLPKERLTYSKSGEDEEPTGLSPVAAAAWRNRKKREAAQREGAKKALSGG